MVYKMEKTFTVAEIRTAMQTIQAFHFCKLLGIMEVIQQGKC
jgi:hypothetical protein